MKCSMGNTVNNTGLSVLSGRHRKNENYPRKKLTCPEVTRRTCQRADSGWGGLGGARRLLVTKFWATPPVPAPRTTLCAGQL